MKANKSMCHYCGSTGGHKPGENCPAYGKQCLKCSKYNHFAKCCHGDQNTQMNRRGTRRNPIRQQQQHRVKKTAESNGESDEEFLKQAAKHVYHQVVSHHETNTVRLRIADLDDTVEPDSGASSSKGGWGGL